ncbi:hypothetical protein B296_00037388 [Ensete ventricosum]|uniref:Uncharacterized protein n=1 Tax=Ensete ventricosum TaxID=4639 RepID=A0A426YAT1_ENSVE|nr:hypothetical protein B296_00037388 [Ensete ventricosum]
MRNGGCNAAKSSRLRWCSFKWLLCCWRVSAEGIWIMEQLRWWRKKRAAAMPAVAGVRLCGLQVEMVVVCKRMWWRCVQQRCGYYRGKKGQQSTWLLQSLCSICAVAFVWQEIDAGHERYRFYWLQEMVAG